MVNSMNRSELEHLLASQFDATLRSDFDKSAFYESKMDYIEYVSVDDVTVSERVDELLTLILSADDRKVVGFRLKGLRWIFNKVRIALELDEEHFVPLTTLLTALVSDAGSDFVSNQNRLLGYKRAFQLAKADHVSISRDDILLAA